MSLQLARRKTLRAAEINQKEIKVNTSAPDSQPEKIFHLLVDVGEGMVESLGKFTHVSVPNPIQELTLSKIPNAVLITHSHDGRVDDLPKLADKVKALSCRITIYCTKECFEQITNKFPTLIETIYLNFTPIRANKDVKIDPLNMIPISANHGENTPPGPVIYVIKFQDKKIIMGWDFLTLIDVDENLMWNPNLLILGTQTDNPHPETGMISVTESYFLLRTWNVKDAI